MAVCLNPPSPSREPQVPKPTPMAKTEQKAQVFRCPRRVFLPVLLISAAAEGLVLPLGQGREHPTSVFASQGSISKCLQDWA